jgi:sugar phosphate isomerase/epimerase
MKFSIARRKFLGSVIGLPWLADSRFRNESPESLHRMAPGCGKGLKTSLNAYSFNGALTDGSMKLGDLLDFCASAGFQGVDLTGYYFSGYPQVPSDEQIYGIKRKAFRLGLEISGTGVRNDFTLAAPEQRAREVELVKEWIAVAAKLAAPVIRIFAGNQKNEGISREQVTDWMLKDIRTCMEYGKQQGVVIGLQNHNDFIQTADQAVQLVESVGSEWLGLIIDTGSYRRFNPYEEIGRSAKYAVNWQIKEKLLLNGQEMDPDLEKLIGLIRASGYQGFLPIETLGPGDTKAKSISLLGKLQTAIG